VGGMLGEQVRLTTSYRVVEARLPGELPEREEPVS